MSVSLFLHLSTDKADSDMKKRSLAGVLLLLLLLLAGCSGKPGTGTGMKSYQASYLELFDTVTYIKGYAPDQESFTRTAEKFHDEMLVYHRLYDIYNEYDGVINICYINAHPGERIRVDRRIMDLLVFSREMAVKTNGKMDITMGSVLSLWHTARMDSIEDPENAYLPDRSALLEAAEHTGFDKIELNEENLTVRILDPELKLDVGSVGKGFAVQQICSTMDSGYLISVGGNVFATGPKRDTGESWVIGIQDPLDPNGEYMHKLNLSCGSVVSSGDYQRYFTVDGQTYHHIIDKDTLFPSVLWRGVTVLCDDSGVADALSTALYVMDRESGEKLLREYGAEAVWTGPDGSRIYSEGYQDRIRH